MVSCGFNLHPQKAKVLISLYDDSPDGALDLAEFANIVRDVRAAAAVRVTR